MLDFELQLLSRRRAVRDWIDALSRAAVTHGVAGAGGEATDPGEWSRLANLEDQAVSELEAVELALDRLRRGSFGLCQQCGEPIPFPQLESQPWTATCTECEVAR